MASIRFSQALHVFRRGGFAGYVSAVNGMVKTQFPCVQHMASHRAAKGNIARASIYPIAHHRVPQRSQMNPDLMGASGMGTAFQKCHLCEALEDFPIRSRRAASRKDAHFVAVNRMASNRLLDAAMGQTGLPPDERQIGFFHGTRLEGFHETAMSGIRFGGNQAAAGVLIQAMDDARPFRATNAA